MRNGAKIFAPYARGTGMPVTYNKYQQQKETTMTKPAARKNDYHECPKEEPIKQAHVGGIILEGSSDVLIDGRAAARLGDKAKCEHGSPDKIIQGSASVFIDHKPAARMGDKTEHGGVIAEGSSNVLIGDGGNPVYIGGKNMVRIGELGKVNVGR